MPTTFSHRRFSSNKVLIDLTVIENVCCRQQKDMVKLIREFVEDVFAVCLDNTNIVQTRDRAFTTITHDIFLFCYRKFHRLTRGVDAAAVIFFVCFE